MTTAALRALLLAFALTLSLVQGVGAEPAAIEVSGVRFAPHQQMDGRTLTLNGAGVRVKMIIKVYALGLYLPQPEADPLAVMSADVPQRVQMVLLRDVDAERMAHSLGHGMLEGLSGGQQAALSDRVHQLMQALIHRGDANRGDVVIADYRPGVGTRISVSGQPVCADIPGADFKQAFLGMWLGGHAADDGLRRKLLGATP